MELGMGAGERRFAHFYAQFHFGSGGIFLFVAEMGM
jgi:hypothetical protein